MLSLLENGHVVLEKTLKDYQCIFITSFLKGTCLLIKRVSFSPKDALIKAFHGDSGEKVEKVYSWIESDA